MSKLKSIFLLVLLTNNHFIRPSLADSKIYVYKEADGAIRFSSTPPPPSVQAKVFQGKKSGFSWYRSSGASKRGRLFTTRYEDHIAQASAEFGVRKELIRAVIHAESAFNPKAVSPKGATGLMQIMPFHFRRLGITEPFNPKQNIRGGSRILSELQGRYRGNTKLILAAYNAGEEAVRKYGGIPPYRETQNYVKKVLSLESRYRATLRR